MSITKSVFWNRKVGICKHVIPCNLIHHLSWLTNLINWGLIYMWMHYRSVCIFMLFVDTDLSVFFLNRHWQRLGNTCMYVEEHLGTRTTFTFTDSTFKPWPGRSYQHSLALYQRAGISWLRSLPVHKNDNSCNFWFTWTITFSYSEDSRCFNHLFFSEFKPEITY